MATRTPFNLGTLKQLDMGKIGAAFDLERSIVVKDCMDRPADPKSRKVVITFSFTPETDPATKTDCESVRVSCEVSSSVPKRRTRDFHMTPHVDGQLSFNPDLPDEPETQTLFEEEERKEDGDAS